MQLRLFRHFVPISVVLLVSSDALLITGAFYQMLSQSAGTAPLVFGITSLPAQLAAGLSIAAVATMVSVGLYGEQSFVDFRLLLGKIAVAFVLVLMLVLVSATYWRRRAATSARHRQPAAEGDPDLARLHLGDARRLPDHPRARVVEAADRCSRQWRPGGAHRQTGRERRKSAFYSGLVHRGCRASAASPAATKSTGREAGPDALADLGYELGASEIVVATDDRRGLPVRQLLHCKLAGIRVTEFLDFWERETRTVDLEALRPSWLFYSDGFRCGIFDELLKRAFDIVVSLALLVFSAPLLLVTACLIKLDSPGPILYRQERVGYRGRVFTIFKFRSMRVDAERDSGPQWAAKGDPRVTRVGAIIRKLRIDELAQVLNVLRGDMSFVGPRPERPYFVANLAAAIPYYNERHWVATGHHRLGADQLSLRRFDRGRPM